MANRYERQQQRYFKQRVYNKIEDKKNVSKAAERRIDKAIKQGKTPAQIAKNEARIAENYARTAARTDATRLEGLARENAYQEIWDMGVMLAKIWNTIMDGHQRDSHGDMNQEEQFVDDKFSNGGIYPGDPNLPPEERYNCRCNTLPLVLELYKLSDSDKQRFIEKINELNDRVLKELGF